MVVPESNFLLCPKVIVRGTFIAENYFNHVVMNFRDLEFNDDCFECVEKFAHPAKKLYICSLSQFTIFSLIFQREAA